MIKPDYLKFKYQAGLTLIELMVAMVIGLLLLMGTVSMFISNKQSYKIQEEMGRLQENARFAIDTMVGDLRMAGHVGCTDDITLLENNITTNAQNLLSFVNTVEGSDDAANWIPGNSTDITANMLPGTDGITIRYIEGNTLQEADLVAGDMVAGSTCNGGVVINAAYDGSVEYPSTGIEPSIHRFIANRYYVGLGTDVDGDGNLDPEDIPSLFRYTVDKEDIDSDGNITELISQELVEGVENMQILYRAGGVYKTADNTIGQADSIRIALLMRSINQNFSEEMDTKTYDLLDKNGVNSLGPFNDYHRRRVFTTTVLIRNNQ